jgi:hypothetical protein
MIPSIWDASTARVLLQRFRRESQALVPNAEGDDDVLGGLHGLNTIQGS